MSDNKSGNLVELGLSELVDGMVINAYIGFESRYLPMDEKVCKWIQHNFKGTMTLIERDGNQMNLPVADTQPGDHLQKIHDFPAALLQITKVNKKLKEELQIRGFERFSVQKPEPGKIASRGFSAKEANEFVQKIKESVNICENAAIAVENMLDNARQGKADTVEIQNFVDNITADESSDAISAIISIKENDQVYAHCVDVAVVFQTTYFGIIQITGQKSVFKDAKEAMLAAFLHDIGKAKVPKEILNSTAPFKRDSKEMELIRTHVDTGAKMLSEMGMPDHFVNMAHYHHVKLDSTMATSYPKGVANGDVMFETRLLALVDAYQALTAGRSYKKSWTPPAVMRYLDATAGVEFDLQLWQHFQKVMGHYPRGSFVKLSDGSYGFVLTVPEKDVLKPQVAVVRSSAGEDLTHHQLVDLAVEQDLTVAQDIDVKSIYPDNALEVFTNINIQ